MGLGSWRYADFFGQSVEQILNCNLSYTVDGVTYENQDEEAMAMVEESPSDIGLNSNQIGDLNYIHKLLLSFYVLYIFTHFFRFFHVN